MTNPIIDALRNMPHDIIAVYVEQEPGMIGNAIRILATRHCWTRGAEQPIPRDSSELGVLDVKMDIRERVPDIVKVIDCDLMPQEIGAMVTAAAKYCGAIDCAKFEDERGRRWLFKPALPPGHPLRGKV
jgi:hypothetical protein